MPRIDPQQLLTCLNVLLSTDGGILSMHEVARLANLMTKFSKKLVSKCIYILILKNTVPDLLSAFMGVGGWDLIQLWLQEGIQNKNWALVAELLGLLLLTPVDVDRLKLNNLPKIVKGLTKREDLKGIQLLSGQLVQQWLKIVKEVTKKDTVKTEYDDKENASVKINEDDISGSTTVNSGDIAVENAAVVDNDANTYTADNGYRLVLRDGKQILCKLLGNEADVVAIDQTHTDTTTKRTYSSGSKHRSSSKSSGRDKDRSSLKKDRDKDRKSSSHSSSRHRSSKYKDKDRDKQADKDKDTLAKIQPASLSKVGRIPKKTDATRDNTKLPQTKSSFSVEVRKTSEDKPKTVKVFNSKLRSTGLMDEARPPPPRHTPKKSLLQKRPSSTVLADVVEKKTRAGELGAIKLIAPKPKPAFLQESDIFMDALAASATKSPKKRKRKLSVSKEAPTSPPATHKPTATSPTSFKTITPANFYQDTLQTNLNDSAAKEEDVENEDEISKQSPEEASSDEATAPIAQTTRVDINGLKGVLSYAKRKGPKKAIRWKPDTDLVEIQYFELDETERINVTKTFMDMARMEMSGEREALLKSRKLINEDIMDAQTAWRTLHEIELPKALVQPGFKSIEKEIQFAREKNVLQAIYFSKLLVPDSSAEPDAETHQMSDPVSIPLEDAEHADDNLPVHSWPEPKGSPPQQQQQPPNPPLNIFNGNPATNAPSPFPNYPPTVMPPFGPDNFMPAPPPPGIMGGAVEWGNEPIISGPPPPPMHNGMFNNGPPPNFLPNKGVPFMPPQFNNGPGFPPPGSFPPPPGRGRGGPFGGMIRGRGGGSGWVRMGGNVNVPWNRNGPPGPPIAPGAKRGRFCNNVKNHGFCRNRETCPFIHPN